MPLMNSQYEAILRTYASRQAKSRRELEERLARIQKKIPSLASLEASLSSLQAEKVRSAVEGDQKQNAWKARLPAFKRNGGAIGSRRLYP